jgi:hypothetical protein
MSGSMEHGRLNDATWLVNIWFYGTW